MTTAKADKLQKEKETEIDIFLSGLVPKHEILTDEEKKQLLIQYGVSEKQMPRIKSTDPVAKKLGAKRGDVVKITRKSPTAGECFYYRVVV